MGDITYTYQHEDFNLGFAYYYTLVLQVNSTGFTYAVVYDDKLVALAPNCSLDELAKPQAMTDELFANFKNIVIGLDAEEFTLVPVEFYNPDRVADFARFLNVQPDERVLSQQLDADNFIVYKTSGSVIDAVEKFDLNHCVYSGKGWVNAIASNTPSDDTLHINIEDNFATLLLFKNGKIRLYNTFEYRTTDDLGYVVSLVFREAGLAQQEVKLSLTGNVQNGDHKARLSEFFSVVEANPLKVAELPDELDPAQLLKLSALLLCVSSEAN